jgi:hypothetical protein
VTISDDVDYLLLRAQQETAKAKAARERGDHKMAVYAHSELAVLYQANANRLRRRPAFH